MGMVLVICVRDAVAVAVGGGGGLFDGCLGLG